MKQYISKDKFMQLLRKETPDTVRFVIFGVLQQEVNGKMHSVENAYAQLCIQYKDTGSLKCMLIANKQEYEEIVQPFYSKKIKPIEEYAANLISTIKVPQFIETKQKLKKRSWIKRLLYGDK